MLILKITLYTKGMLLTEKQCLELHYTIYIYVFLIELQSNI